MKTKHKAQFTGVIIHNTESNTYTGIVKEIDGVVITAKSMEEVIEMIPMAIERILVVKSSLKSLPETIGSDNFYTKDFNYELELA